MLRVTLEIVPQGVEEKKFEIGQLLIFNKGYATKTGDLCNYGVISLDEGKEGMYTEDIQHFRKQGAWTLLRLVLDRFKIEGP